MGGKRKGKNKNPKLGLATNNNVGKGKKENKKEKFSCQLCKEYNLTHQCPKLEDAQHFLSQREAPQ
jgi:hypothetical protein